MNVSARQMHDENFVARSLGIIRGAGADPVRLSMELTESLLATDIEATIKEMYSLRREAVCFSIDGFGTGFSSLGCRAFQGYLPAAPMPVEQVEAMLQAR